MRIFHNIDVQVRILPPQGHPGEAEVYYPDIVPAAHIHHRPEPDEVREEVEAYVEEPEEVPEEVEEESEEYLEEATELVAEAAPTPVEVLPAAERTPLPEPKPIEVRRQKSRPEVRRVVVVQPEPEIDWLWYERNSERFEDDWIESEERASEAVPPPDLWWQRNGKEVPTS